MSTQSIALYNKLQNPIESAEKLGVWIAKSGMFGCEKTEQGQVLAIACFTEGMTIFQLKRKYHLISGELIQKALAVLAEFRGKGGKHRWVKTGQDGKVAELELTFDGQTITTVFTIEDAQRQGLIRKGSAWEKTPGNMLRARCISNGVAMIAPEITHGIVVDGDEMAAAPAPTIDLGSHPQQFAKPEPQQQPQKAEVIEVKAEVVTKPAATEPASPTPSIQPAGNIDVQTVNQVESAIGAENAPKALAWLKAKGWIQNSLSDLSPANAQKIIDKPDKFKAAISKN